MLFKIFTFHVALFLKRAATARLRGVNTIGMCQLSKLVIEYRMETGRFNFKNNFYVFDLFLYEKNQQKAVF